MRDLLSFAHFWAQNERFAQKTYEQIPSPDFFLFHINIPVQKRNQIWKNKNPGSVFRQKGPDLHSTTLNEGSGKTTLLFCMSGIVDGKKDLTNPDYRTKPDFLKFFFQSCGSVYIFLLIRIQVLFSMRFRIQLLF